MANKLSTGNKISVLEKKEIKAASLEPEALTHFPAKVFQSILTDTIILNNEIIGAAGPGACRHIEASGRVLRVETFIQIKVANPGAEISCWRVAA